MNGLVNSQGHIWGGFGPPGSLKGHHKKKKGKVKKERERKKNKGKERENEKKGTRKRKDRKANQHDKRGAIQAQAGAPGKKTPLQLCCRVPKLMTHWALRAVISWIRP